MVKTVVKAHYVHKSNLKELIEKIPDDKREDFINFMKLVNENLIEYDVIKYDRGNITLISSPDWDSSNEPIVGICRRWKVGEWFGLSNKLGIPKTTSNFKQIYHNKWQFVASDYEGFDVEKAKERTLLWNSIPNLNKSKIGYKEYWICLLKENNIEI